jgi:hypothetical protein
MRKFSERVLLLVLSIADKVALLDMVRLSQVSTSPFSLLIVAMDLVSYRHADKRFFRYLIWNDHTVVYPGNGRDSPRFSSCIRSRWPRKSCTMLRFCLSPVLVR